MSRPRSTPAGGHLPVMLAEVLAALRPSAGQTIADVTVGLAGHAAVILERLRPDGLLIGMDFDPANLEVARSALAGVAPDGFHLHQGNFAALPKLLSGAGIPQLNGLLADLGISSPQLDDPERGFSHRRDGPLDMRLDPTRGRTACQVLESLTAEKLAIHLAELGDEPRAGAIAAAILARRPERTRELAEAIRETVPWEAMRGTLARVFQTLRILVNRELANLEELLRQLPNLLAPGGRAAIISFHSGEDRLVKAAFRDGLRSGTYRAVEGPIRPSFEEIGANPRSRSAKLRWAERA